MLRRNSTGAFTRPSSRLYPHQWLWDSCFVAIGLRHLHVDRAADELLSLFRGQWPNGMLPHITFSPTPEPYHADAKLWQVRQTVVPPPEVETSGITQPPLVAEAVARVGELMPADRRLAFYRRVLPNLTRYHEWLYQERDPDDTGLVTVVHPWESGMDDTPPWTAATRYLAPPRVRSLRQSGSVDALDAIRRDTKEVPAEERIAGDELFTLYELTRRQRAAEYRFAAIRDEGLPLIRDVGFNSILVRANHQLEMIAADAGRPLPVDLQRAMRATKVAFTDLLSSGGFPRHRDGRDNRPLAHETVAGFLALYAVASPSASLDNLADQLSDSRWNGAYGPASSPLDAPSFDPRRYWRGPVWPMTNWLISDGLQRLGRTHAARKLRRATIELVVRSGRPFEYYSPLDGTGAGAPDFAPTAAVFLDFTRSEGLHQ